MTITRIAVAAISVSLLGLPTFAWGDDWQVTKLRGNAAMLVGESWQPLRRGDVVSDDRAIRTVGGSRMTLERGLESLDLGPDTAIRIDDRAGQKYTTIKQYFGAVGVEAEVRNVKHFAVVSPDLAAVVKGTRFTVTVGESGSQVSVQRGTVAVTDGDTGESVLLDAGESASTAEGEGLEVEGSDAPEVHGKSAFSGKANAPGQLKKSDEDAPTHATGKGHTFGNANSGGSHAGGNGDGDSGSSNAGGNGGGSNSGGGSSNAGGHGNGRN